MAIKREMEDKYILNILVWGLLQNDDNFNIILAPFILEGINFTLEAT